MMTTSVDLAGVRERVRDALPILEVARMLQLVLRLEQNGRKGTGLCPFHSERSGSFVVGGKAPDRYFCFGCGENGDQFDLWGKLRGVDHKTAVLQQAQIAGVYVGEMQFDGLPKGRPMQRAEKRPDVRDDASSKPSLPPLMKPSRAAVERIAAGRGLDPEAVWIAARVHRRVGYAMWPQYQSRHDGQWRVREVGAHPSWAAMDETRNVAEFRRLDNGMYQRADGAELKCWSTAGKAWPLGAAQIGERKRVLLVEGGPDMLAAYHFLRMWDSVRRPLLREVAVVCMLGASNRIREDALGCFAGCRVRIMVDGDRPKDDENKSKRKLPGLEAAARWTRQLCDAGAAVECFYVGDVFLPGDIAEWHEGTRKAAEIRVEVEGFHLPDGSKAKDLNDVARCGEEVTRGDDMRQAMVDWDF